MKKTLFFVVLIACASQLKAQNSNAVPNNNALDKFFKLKPLSTDSNLSKLIPLLPQKGNSSNLNSTTLNTRELYADETVYSRMPVVKTYPRDNMPIVKPDEPGMKYRMLIKRMDIVNPDTVKLKKGKVTP